MESKQPIRRGTVIQTEDYHLEFELFEDALFLHLNIDIWTPSKFKQYMVVWKMVLDSLNSRGYDSVYCIVPYDDKTIKFEKMFGFKEHTRLDKGLLMQRSTEWV